MTDPGPRTAGARHFPGFDAIRGLAVLAVILFHVASLTGRLGLGASGRVAQVLGGQAVIVFFVLSGFLLYRPFVAARAAGRPGPDTRRFLRRRAARILPAYWVALTVLAVFPGIVGPFGHDGWRYYGLLQVYDPQTIDRGIPVAWTLCVEATFYLALPVWAAAMRVGREGSGSWVRREALALGALFAVGAGVQLLRSQQAIGRVWADALPGQAAWFALGMGLAVASVALGDRRPALARHPGACWLGVLAAIAGLAALVPRGGLLGLVAALDRPQPLGEATLKIAGSAALAVLLLVPAVFEQPARASLPARILATRPVAFVGAISYSLYLYHLTLAELLALPADPGHFRADGLHLVASLDRGQTLALLAATLAVALPVGWASRRWVELPFLRRR